MDRQNSRRESLEKLVNKEQIKFTISGNYDFILNDLNFSNDLSWLDFQCRVSINYLDIVNNNKDNLCMKLFILWLLNNNIPRYATYISKELLRFINLGLRKFMYES